MINSFIKILSIVNKHIKFNNLNFEHVVFKSLYILPNALSAEKSYLFFDIMIHEDVKYMIIIFQNISKKFFNL